MPGSWGPMPIVEGQCTSWKVGACRLWAQVTYDEWAIAHRYEADACGEGEERPRLECDDIDDWTRYVTVANDQLEVVPALPDRPVVVRPEAPIVILPERWGRFYFSVPLWVRFVSKPNGSSVVMEEIPSRKPASTWFGDVAGGELCYAIDAPLGRRVEHMTADDSYATCQVTVRNTSRERLRFERICVHVESMRLFAARDRYWTNEVRVSFRGADQVSQLSFLPKPPESVGEVTPVCEPRVPPEVGILKRSFALIREITGI